MSLKITTWNLEHSNRLIKDSPNSQIRERRRRVKETLEEINPDILCIQEGPKGEHGIHDFAEQVLDNDWVPVLLRGEGDELGDRDREYKLKGTQWIWFLVRPSMLDSCRIQAPEVWQDFTVQKKWDVYYWGKYKKVQHSHYRHPQVLIYKLPDGNEMELIGVHLKSKINKMRVIFDSEGNLNQSYVDEAIKARVKLATEARDVRRYLDAKFEQEEHPAIVVLGDCNDGPGHDHFETNYLYFDLISNLQGEVMLAERFFNHALFTYSNRLRWSARYRDKIKKISARNNPLLIDHILLSQGLCQGHFPLQANRNSGKVEHTIFERVNAGSNSKTRTSDHRPVSCTLFDD